MIGALLAEGERGVNSLDLLISELHPDVLADIVITNMKHLPKNNPPPFAPVGTFSLPRASDSTNLSQIMAPIDSSLGQQSWVPVSQTPISLSTATCSTFPEMPTSASLPLDSKRDPRRVSKTKLFQVYSLLFVLNVSLTSDSPITNCLLHHDASQDPRRLDPRRTAVAVEVSPPFVAEHNISATQSAILQSDINPSSSSNIDIAVPLMSSSECMPMTYLKMETNSITGESSPGPVVGLLAPKEEGHEEDLNEAIPDRKSDPTIHVPLLSPGKVEPELVPEIPSEVGVTNEIYSPLLETDQLSPPISTAATPEDACEDLPALPPFIELTDEQQRNMGTLAVEQIIDSYKKLKETDSKHTGMALLSRLVAQVGSNLLIFNY